MELNYKKSDTIVISDIHIGSKNSKTDKLYDFLDLLLENPPKRLIVAGDLFELWSTSYKKIGKYDHKVIRKILELSQNKIEIIDRKSTRLNSSHTDISRMPSSA